ncbi:MAG: SDR family oxidoreductase [Kiritimatiellia bacterium]
MTGSVLVTGGGRRIGFSICETLRARGWNVVVHSRDATSPLGADLGDPGAADALFEKACACAPDLCAIVNNAAEFSVSPELSPARAARLMRVNAEAPRRLTELLHARLAGRGGRGAVVNLLDVRVLLRAARTPYERSKRELLAATRAQAVACAPVLRVNAVAPGPVLAPADAANRERGGAVLLDHRPTPQDVAEAVAFLLEGRSVTGQVVPVDAGQSLLPA